MVGKRIASQGSQRQSGRSVASTGARIIARETALMVALRLYRQPVFARTLRKLPLSDNVLEVIRIAAGCSETMLGAMQSTRLDEATLAHAASLYLLVVLFPVDADPWRTLGLAAGAPESAAREHRRWLMKWLHPDRHSNPALASFSVRVLEASARLSSEKLERNAPMLDSRSVFHVAW